MNGRLQLKPGELRRRRLLALLTQEELARKAGLSGSAISYMELGQKQPRPGALKAIAKVLKCDPFELAEITEDVEEATA